MEPRYSADEKDELKVGECLNLISNYQGGLVPIIATKDAVIIQLENIGDELLPFISVECKDENRYPALKALARDIARLL